MSEKNLCALRERATRHLNNSIFAINSIFHSICGHVIGTSTVLIYMTFPKAKSPDVSERRVEDRRSENRERQKLSSKGRTVYQRALILYSTVAENGFIPAFGFGYLWESDGTPSTIYSISLVILELRSATSFPLFF